MLFPNPVSSRILVRKSLAATFTEAGDVFATEIEAFLAEEALTRSMKGEETEVKNSSLLKETSKDDRLKRMGKRLIVIAARSILLSSLGGVGPNICFTVTDEGTASLTDFCSV